MFEIKSALLVALFLLFWVDGSKTFNIDVSRDVVTTIKVGTSDDNLTSVLPGKQMTFSRNGSKLSIFLGTPPAVGPSGNGSVWQCRVTVNDSSPGDWITDTNCTSILSREYLPEERANHLMGGGGLGRTLFPLSSPDQQMVCASRREGQCGTVYSTPGSCYRGTIPTSLKWVDWKEQSCYTKRFDVLFLVDASNSITNTEFESMRTVLKSAAESFEYLIGVNTQIEILLYGQLNGRNLTYLSSSNRHYNVPLAFGQCISLRCTQEAIQKMKHLRAANTYTARAIERAVKIDLAQSRFASVAKKIIILITDGQATDYKLLSSSYALTKTNNVTVYAVGVGSKVDEDQLKTSANNGKSDERVYLTTSFDKLLNSLQNVTSDIIQASGDGLVVRSVDEDVIDTLFGFSGHKTKENQVVMGVVGAHSGYGSVAKFDSTTADWPELMSFANVSKLLPTEDPRGTESYLGYDVTSGNYNGGNVTYVAVSAPKYHMHGAVVIFSQTAFGTSDMESYTILPYSCAGCMHDYKQLGSYFGATVLSVDVNGDRADDLLVGAPLFVGDNYDEGRVFVYLSEADNTLTTWSNAYVYIPTALFGEKDINGRFGSSMTSAGDVNNDGYNDVIIAAPMAGDGKGVIFLYHGGPNGLANVIQQKITASSLFDPSIRTFGLSVLGNVDVNDNQIPDVIISSPTSDRITILRTKPIVRFNTTFQFANSSLEYIRCISFENTTCLILQTCFSYDGKSVEEEVDIHVNISIDTELNRLEIEHPYIYNVQPGMYDFNITLVKYNITCLDLDVRPLTHSLTDLDTMIVANLTYSIPESHKTKPLSSVEQQNVNHDFSATAVFDKSCDEYCHYDLSIKSDLQLPSFFNTDVPTLVVANDDTFKLKLNISHQGDNAFGPFVKLSYSPVLTWLKIINFASYDPDHPICFRPTAATQARGDELSTQTLTYDDAYTKTVMTNKSWCYFEVVFSHGNLKDNGALPEVMLMVLLNTTVTQNSSVEMDQSDNIVNISLPVKYRSSVAAKISGESEIPFNFTEGPTTISSIFNIGQNTSNVLIETELRGTGFSNIPKSNVTILFPSKLDSNRTLLYPFHLQCTATGTASCTCNTSNVDTEGFLQMQNSTRNFSSTPNPVPLQLTSYDCQSSMTSTGFECDQLTCEINNLGENETVKIQATFRVWTQTLRLQENQNETKLVTEVKYSAAASPLVMDEHGYPIPPHFSNITTTAIRYVAPPIVYVFPLWATLVIAIGSGIVLVGVLALILYKKGFFENEFTKMLKDAKWEEAGTHHNNVYESEMPTQDNSEKPSDIVNEEQPPKYTPEPVHVFKMDGTDNTYVNEASN